MTCQRCGLDIDIDAIMAAYETEAIYMLEMLSLCPECSKDVPGVDLEQYEKDENDNCHGQNT